MTEKPDLDLTAAKNALNEFVTRDGQDAADKLTKIFADAARKIANELSRGALRSQTPLQQVAGGLLGQLGAMAVDKIFSRTATPSSSKSNHAPNSSVTVNVQMPAGASADGLHRSAAQIAAHVARAADYGRRNG